ncbi:MAG: DUF86 domain-containing protein [bacterium]|nr:DUF86 domain-containing protein [bacterium]
MHNYDGIDTTIVWAIVKKHLPILEFINVGFV